jgi:hypothetical protein
MFKSGSSRIAAAHKYVNAMLNVSYITGFVRKPEGRSFLIQQKTESADLVHAIPVQVGDGIAVPREFTPITATCHVYGVKSQDGLRNAELRVIDMRTPSTRSMPLWLAWNAAMPEGIKLDGFNPFRAGAIKPEYAAGHDEAPDDPLRLVLEATRGRLDTRLGDNANVAMLAGVVEGAAYLKPTEHQQGYIAALIRQHKNPDQSIPVRLYSNKPQSHLSSICIGAPVKVVGQIRVKLIHGEPESVDDAPVILGRQLYIRCGEFSVAQRGTEDHPGDIRFPLPEWWHEMVQRRREEVQGNKASHHDAGPEQEKAVHAVSDIVADPSL